MVDKILDLLRLMRITQWLKNLFLFAPLIFSKHLFEISYLWNAFFAFLCFSFASSAIYIINDIVDIESDKYHPIKKNRPITSGRISIPAAFIILALLIIVIVTMIPMFSWYFWNTLFLYIVINIAYTFWLKQIVLIDVFAVAAGFMLRVLAGVFAIDVEISPWLVLCTLFISVFLAFSKRRGELILSNKRNHVITRQVLKQYDIEFIDQIMIIAASGMAISYALYTVAPRTIHIYGTENLIFTTVFVLFGIFRYILLMRRKKIDDNPMHILLTDIPLVVNIFLWFISCVLIIYFK